jgi:hypothetical protein
LRFKDVLLSMRFWKRLTRIAAITHSLT